MTTGQLLIRGDKHLSQIHRAHVRQTLDNAIQTAPAYQTRIRDGVYRPDEQTFRDAYNVLDLASMPSKTREVAFEVLNRTVWTNNKAFKSGMAPAPDCDRCGQIETMEHLLHDCPHYSQNFWEEVSAVLHSSLQDLSGVDIPRIQLTPREIVFNALHPSVLLHARDAKTRQALVLLTQELKRSIIHKRMNATAQAGVDTPIVRIQAHILSTIKKIRSYLRYQGIYTHAEPLRLMDIMCQHTLNRID
jgi:hypothetical protein